MRTCTQTDTRTRNCLGHASIASVVIYRTTDLELAIGCYSAARDAFPISAVSIGRDGKWVVIRAIGCDLRDVETFCNGFAAGYGHRDEISDRQEAGLDRLMEDVQGSPTLEEREAEMFAAMEDIHGSGIAEMSNDQG